MSDEGLPAAIEEILRDMLYADPGNCIPEAAAEIASRLPVLLQQDGWLPPGTSDRIRAWMETARQTPDKHLNRDTLTSLLCELADILNGTIP